MAKFPSKSRRPRATPDSEAESRPSPLVIMAGRLHSSAVPDSSAPTAAAASAPTSNDTPAAAPLPTPLSPRRMVAATRFAPPPMPVADPPPPTAPPPPPVAAFRHDSARDAVRDTVRDTVRDAVPAPNAAPATTAVRPLRVTDAERDAANRTLHRLENSRQFQQRTTALILSGSAFVVLIAGGGYMGYRYWRHHQWTKAMDELGVVNRAEYAKKTAEVSPEARYALEDAERLKQHNQTDEAARALDRAAKALDAGKNGKASPLDLKIAVKNRQGMLLGQAGSYGQAAQAFREALVLAPTNPDIQVNLAVALIGVGTTAGSTPAAVTAAYAEAIKLLKKEVAAHPDDLRGRYNLAKVLSLSGNEYEASREQAQFILRSNAAAAAQSKSGGASPALNGQAAGIGAALGAPGP